MSDSHGLTTEDALVKLKQILQDEVTSYRRHKPNQLFRLLQIFSLNDLSPISWLGILCVLVELVAIIINLSSNDHGRSTSLCLEIVIIVLLLVVVVASSLREGYLAENEVERRIMQVYNNIGDESSLYDELPDLSIPESNSMTLVWTYRDNKIVNLPWNLLVEGDIIILGPSRVAPADCRQVISVNTKCHPIVLPVTLEAGDTYNPSTDYHSDKEEDVACKPYPRQRFEVLQAPTRIIIRSYLELGARKNITTSWKDVNLISRIIETQIIWIFMICKHWVHRECSFRKIKS